MASGFSQSDLEPVEHRWTHGQYFGPPSTDGAWFELYRNMLIHETDDGGLVLGLATPRAWLADGKEIDVQNAPTYYGELSMHLRSAVSKGEIRAEIEAPARTHPRALIVRLRHPNKKPMRSVTVNGHRWSDFDVRKEWIRIPNPVERHYSVVASY
jgi:3',5'-cyclic AMP phosphodiesterase CpdA